MLLPDGLVLAAGGSMARRCPELYDPATGTWTPTAFLNTSRLVIRGSHQKGVDALVTLHGFENDLIYDFKSRRRHTFDGRRGK